ncbi:hypothetical protein A1Q1_08045 [Trichosporon asahii var. asahii CBS 2479]|uniref:Uncharacterized protein n=1 Tax=Trichosporon asahii var. asahii (strain ATCC 90039 / CBS 2479 / JCM 2466 / KCTC 7840 / NBRC 103889/ NCYC 2677 / UAMH 7654) TaxID=1186058 RepID=J6F646_TRIAS|nr:hypothetical protein A1Q1_08045 [Trichosporon asahii var. asahii CBS 2479]EJT50787.1 hypothetical protein A1Q1_08045 [Trichosporon asahii var. asahii CBS 2479]
MTTAIPQPSLPPTHPLSIEIQSLKQQISQYRQIAHQSYIEIQGVRLELELKKDEVTGLERKNEALKQEVETLRTTPEPPQAPPPANALAELSLAHRRLSAKLDFTEQQLRSVTLELASSKQELGRVLKEKEHEKALLNELRVGEEDREEEVAWERGERKRMEEQKKLCAVPPPLPRRLSDNILQKTPILTDAEDKEEAVKLEAKAEPKENGKPEEAVKDDDAEKDSKSDKSAPASPPKSTHRSSASISSITQSSDAISNLLIGQRGVARLFKDFTSVVSGKDKEIARLLNRVDELEVALGALREQLEAETTALVDAQAERDRVLRDDASAAKVVERYMTFSQKAHETVHSHLGHLRSRTSATQATLRNEAAVLRRRIEAEVERSNRLRAATEEMADELGKESAGRRREVAMRLQLIAAEETRARRAESWLDRVRRFRSEGAEIDSNLLAPLLDEAVAILSPAAPVEPKAGGKWRGMFGRRKSVSASVPAAATPDEESLARIFLAEELVQHLVNDLQIETERRMELEKQRVAWLAREAEEGVPPETDEDGDKVDDTGMLFSVENEDDSEEESASEDDTERPEENGDLPEDVKSEDKGDKEIKENGLKSPKKSKKARKVSNAAESTAGDGNVKLPELKVTTTMAEKEHLDELQAIFEPLEQRYIPLQKSLHDQSVALQHLKTSVPELAPRRPGLRAVSLNLKGRSEHDDLISLLDGLYEVIEDARVDTEIAMADEDRVFHGFAALLDVGGRGVVQAASVLRDARSYAASRSGDGTTYARLSVRVSDIEHDLMTIKRAMHEHAGEVEPEEVQPQVNGMAALGRRKPSLWQSLPLKTVTASRGPVLLSPLTALRSGSPDLSGDDLIQRRSASSPIGLLSSVGRSLSSGVGAMGNGITGGGRKVSDLAAGALYLPTRSRRNTVNSQTSDAKDEKKSEAADEGTPAENGERPTPPPKDEEKEEPERKGEVDDVE